MEYFSASLALLLWEFISDAIKQMVKWPVIWEAMMAMGNHYHGNQPVLRMPQFMNLGNPGFHFCIKLDQNLELT